MPTMLTDDNTYYELLEVAPDASPQELRAAYLRAKSAYRKDSVALYTLITESETEELLAKIEEAYQVLSHPERRRAYDRNHGLLSAEEEMIERLRAPKNQKIVSIDRVPPMESSFPDTDLLVPPSTDFTSATLPSAPSVLSSPSTTEVLGSSSPESAHAENTTPSRGRLLAPPRHSGDPRLNAELAEEIRTEIDWRGHFLRRIREARKVSIEELAEFTKISRTYILAIEEENYSKLPAAVYLRGFITQVAKYLKVPEEKVATAYMARYNQIRDARKN